VTSIATQRMLERALDTVAVLVDAHVALGFTLDVHLTIDRIVMRCPRPEDELAVAPLVAKLPALEPIDPFSPRRAQSAGASVMCAAHVGGDEIAAASMYGRHLRRHGYAPPICAYFRRDGRIAMGMTLLRRLDAALFDSRAVRLLAEWQPFLQDAFALDGVPPEAPAGPPLTEREAAGAALVAAGSSNAEVAVTLGTTEGTVKAHLTKVYAKLGVRSRTQLAVTLPRAAVVDGPARVVAELTPTFG
jgi:DNA-binding CsgD family transcriptional regulator